MNRSCYYCGSVNIVKNGRTYYGKARGKCKDCSRQFVFERRNRQLSPGQQRRIELLLLDRISLEGICRVLDVPAYHLYRYMDELYKQVIPAERHSISGRKKGTNHAERFFCTLRHRCSRLVRKALSFSKRLERHLMAIRFFFANYNLSLLL